MKQQFESTLAFPVKPFGLWELTKLPSSTMLARGARIAAMLPRRAVGCRLMSSLNNRDLAVPFHIPSIAYGNHKPSNIFVSKNVTSKFIALNRPEVPPPPRSMMFPSCNVYRGRNDSSSNQDSDTNI